VKSSEGTSAEGQREDRIPLDPRILSAITYVAQYMGDCDDWVDIKIEIMNSIRPELRRLFSRRSQQTYEQVVSEFDRAVWDEYVRVSGVTLVLRTVEERRALRTGVADE